MPQCFREGESFLEINGIDHWVKIAGVKNKTIPIVIVHGGPGGHAYNFERTPGPLLEEFATIVYYEQRGCGRSKAPADTTDYTIPTLIDDLDDLRHELLLEKMNLLGFSFGAELALRYTAVHPERVNKLILSSPAEISPLTALVQIQGFYSVADDTLRAEIESVLMENTAIIDKLLKIWDNTSTSVFDKFSFNNPRAAKLNRELWNESHLAHEGTPHFQNVIFESSKGDLLETAAGLETDCLIISGIHDKNGGLHYGLYLDEIMPHSELKLYRNSAHFPDIEEPERYAKDIKSFIECHDS
jgi:proline iminopeptidase